jgi:hypothetical protein
MNVDISNLEPGTPGVSHGAGLLGELIRHATGSWAGHAFMYIGNGLCVQGTAPRADIVPATTFGDAIWAWHMWDELTLHNGWDAKAVAVGQQKVVARSRAEVGTPYDYIAYAGFGLEVLNLRHEDQLAAEFRQDSWRVCSALVADALTFGGVPLDFIPEDGPGLEKDLSVKVGMPPNLVAPGMLLGLFQRLNWA